MLRQSSLKPRQDVMLHNVEVIAQKIKAGSVFDLAVRFTATNDAELLQKILRHKNLFEMITETFVENNQTSLDYILRVLSKFPATKELGLRQTKSTAVQGYSLIMARDKLNHLTKLSLNGCIWSDTSGKAFTRALAMNSSIEDLLVDNGTVTGLFFMRFADAVTRREKIFREIRTTMYHSDLHDEKDFPFALRHLFRIAANRNVIELFRVFVNSRDLNHELMRIICGEVAKTPPLKLKGAETATQLNIQLGIAYNDQLIPTCYDQRVDFVNAKISSFG